MMMECLQWSFGCSRRASTAASPRRRARGRTARPTPRPPASAPTPASTGSRASPRRSARSPRPPLPRRRHANSSRYMSAAVLVLRPDGQKIEHTNEPLSLLYFNFFYMRVRPDRMANYHIPYRRVSFIYYSNVVWEFSYDFF